MAVLPAIGRGISPNGDYDPYSFLQRQRENDQLYNSSLVPQTPERSWTQGLARMLQSGVSGYNQAGLDQGMADYKQSKLDDMKTLGDYLSGNTTGNFGDVVGNLNDPSSQNLALSIAQGVNKNNADLQKQISLQNNAFQLQRQGKAQDFGYDLQKGQVANSYKRQDMGLQSDLNKDAATFDPMKAQEQKVAQYSQVVSDDNASPEIRTQAQVLLDASKKTLESMKTPPIRLNLKNQLGGPDQKVQDQGVSANDRLSTINQIMSDIGDGTVNSRNITDIGQGIQTSLARLGLPSDSAAVGRYQQNIIQSTLDAVKELQAAGGVRITKPMIDLIQKSKIVAGEPIESAYPKLFVIQQAFDRASKLRDLNQKWTGTYGGTDKKAPDGHTYNDAVYDFMNDNPVITYEQSLKQKAAATQQQTLATPQTPPEQPQVLSTETLPAAGG